MVDAIKTKVSIIETTRATMDIIIRDTITRDTINNSTIQTVHIPSSQIFNHQYIQIKMFKDQARDTRTSFSSAVVTNRLNRDGPYILGQGDKFGENLGSAATCFAEAGFQIDASNSAYDWPLALRGPRLKLKPPSYWLRALSSQHHIENLSKHVDIDGNLFKTNVVANLYDIQTSQKCQQECSRQRECEYFVWEAATKNCDLYHDLKK